MKASWLIINKKLNEVHLRETKKALSVMPSTSTHNWPCIQNFPSNNNSRIAVCLVILICLLAVKSSPIHAQKSTTGPFPAKNINSGVLTSSSAQAEIPNVPSYIWHHGCGPTALGMVVGYWDSNGFPLLIPGDASNQTQEVCAVIADDNDNPTCGNGIIEFGYDDGTCEKTASWFNHNSTDGPWILFQDNNQSSWGYRVLAPSNYISNPVDDRIVGFGATYTAPHKMHIKKIKFYFNNPLSIGLGFYLTLLNHYNFPLLMINNFISSDYVVTGWWEHDISHLDIIIEADKIFKAGLCQSYLPYFEIPPNFPLPSRPVFLGVDESISGHSWFIRNGYIYNDSWAQYMVRVEASLIDYVGDHYQDYSCPRDSFPGPIQPDKSELGGAHISNCIADFMKTSWSSVNLYYGSSYFMYIDSAFTNYVNYICPEYSATANSVRFAEFSFAHFINEIDSGKPMVLLVDIDGNDTTDHFVTGIGYDDEKMMYGVYNTWDNSVHWYDWCEMANGQEWGIYGITTFSIEENNATMLHVYQCTFVGEGIKVSWELSEAGSCMEFSVFRKAAENDLFIPIKANIINSEIMSYSFIDRTFELGSGYCYRVEVIDDMGPKTLFITEIISAKIPKLTLDQNYPNPFNPRTTIKYYLPENCSVILEIFDVSGKCIASLVNEFQEMGQYAIDWNGQDQNGNQISSGTYLYRLKAGKETISKKMILLR